MTEAPKCLVQEPTNDMIEAAYTLLSSRPINTEARAKHMVREVWLAMWDAAQKPQTMGLTFKQREVHNFIAEYIGKHNQPPLWREIIAGTTVATDRHLVSIINSLERMGIVSRIKQKQRGLILHTWPGEQIPNPILRNQNRKKKK